MTDVCRIPKAGGYGVKWPKLSEALMHCFGRDHANAHGALPDAMATLDLLRWMRGDGLLPEPTLGSGRAAA